MVKGGGQSETEHRQDLVKRYFAALLFLTVMIGLCLRALASDHEFIGQWDEAYHALVAKNFLKHPLTPILLADCPANYDYHFWNQTRVWLHKPPMAIWLMALAIRVGGEQEFMLRVPSILADTMLVLLIGLMTRSILGESGALLAALLWAICPSLILLVSGQRATDHPDVFLCFFSNLCLMMALRLDRETTSSDPPKPGTLVLFGLFWGLAYLTKGIAAAPILLILLAHAALRERMDITLFHGWRKKLQSVGWLACGMSVALPWTLYSSFLYHRELGLERAYDLRHLFEPLEGHGGWILYHFEVIAQNVTGVESRFLAGFGLVVILATLFSGWRSKQSSRRLLCIWVAVYFFSYTLAATRLKNYCLPAYPAFFILLSGLILDDMKQRSRSHLFGLDRHLLGQLILLILIGSMSLRTAAAIQRVQDPFYLEKESLIMNYRDMRAEMKKQARDARPALIWCAPDITNIQASFYSGKTVLPITPTHEDLLTAKQKGLRNLIIVPLNSPDIRQIESRWRAEGVEVEFLPIQMRRPH